MESLTDTTDSHSILRSEIYYYLQWRLLLGDLSRHTGTFSKGDNVGQFKSIPPKTIPTTIGQAESKMKVLKLIQLSDRKIGRIDEFITIYHNDLIG